jgi:hypothetical protein
MQTTTINQSPIVLPEKLLYGTKEACAVLSIKPKKLHDLIARGLLMKHPSFKKVLIFRKELERFAQVR